jgi:hypothetical protein
MKDLLCTESLFSQAFRNSSISFMFKLVKSFFIDTLKKPRETRIMHSSVGFHDDFYNVSTVPVFFRHFGCIDRYERDSPLKKGAVGAAFRQFHLLAVKIGKQESIRRRNQIIPNKIRRQIESFGRFLSGAYDIHIRGSFKE